MAGGLVVVISLVLHDVCPPRVCLKKLHVSVLVGSERERLDSLLYRNSIVRSALV